ncbi:uncharacterized protein B0I36DRAFT_67283 [Microdochium trichocladiopsis]|uniref:F-box domain-containing protein n=1 Tax=Microdochium trichocladiopsis TaxID=1682393 RepID=A0A9P8YEH3_9PEZI|nr:uncharacterized protein B0I36DRAFT_67283 [Microdochium trichocladiopsis]KAH7037521.1 hypothetical protein B0I36DRAFT_67283 [Microdochium trichocladiopsis]
MASRRSTWCSLCGVIISPSQGNPDETADHELSWLSDVRVVRTLGPQWDVIITGVGYLSNRKQVCASADPSDHWRITPSHTSHDDGDVSGIPAQAGFAPHHSLYNSSRSYWCFPIHDSCWHFLWDKVSSCNREDVPQEALARHLFAIFYNTPIHAYDQLMPGHDYGGAAGLRQITRRQGYYYQVRASQYPYLIGNPHEALQTDEHCLWEAVQAIAVPFNRPEVHLRDRVAVAGETGGAAAEVDGADDDPFTRLPYEVVVIVFTYLPSVDMCKLRLASRAAAHISSPQRLPQAFWRSRFDPEFEMGFVFAGASRQTTKAQMDWRDLYVKARATLSEFELFPGFKNRQRIWFSLHDIASVIRVRLRNKDCTSQVPYAEMTPPLLPDEKHGSWVCADAALAPGPAHSLAQFELAANCRLMEMHKITWLPSFQGQVRLKASFADYCGKTYISGLCLDGVASDGGSAHSERAGFVNTTRFQYIELDSSWEIWRVEIALCCTGLIGVRLHFRGHGSTVVKSIGQIPPPAADIGISDLPIPYNARISGLVVGLDAFKVVSLSVVEETHAGAVHNGTAFPLTREFAPPSEIWIPTAPRVPVSWRFKSAQKSQLHNLCLNMDFGGHDGSQLPRLTQVVARMTQYPAVFAGMKFVYVDGTVKEFGARNGLPVAGDVSDLVLEQVFSIDGPGGEVIDRVVVSYSMDHENVRRISVYTNHNRSIDFALQSKSEPNDTLSVKVFEPKPGSLLTAFFAKIKMSAVLPGRTSLTWLQYDLRGYFRNFSVGTAPKDPLPGICVQEATQSTSIDHMIPINRKTLAPVEMMLRHHGGFVFAAADLANVKRIRVSIGGKGDDLHADMITGLWIEYHDSNLPVIIGQWKEEYDTIELDADDRLVAMQIWHDWNSIDKRLPLGPVVGLLFRLASGTEKKIARRYVVERDCLSFRENMYESMTGVLWGCNHKWDHVWVLMTPNPNVPRLLLVQDTADLIQSPVMTDILQEKVFIFGEGLPENNHNPLTSVEVTFWKHDKVPNSIRLYFRHGPPRVLGHPQSVHRPQRIDLDVDGGEELTSMRLGIIGHGDTSQIAFITFTTNKDRKLDFREEWWSAPSTAITRWHEKVPLHVFYPFAPETAETSRRVAAALARPDTTASTGGGADASRPAAPGGAGRYSPFASSPLVFRMGERYGVPLDRGPGGTAGNRNSSTPNSVVVAATTMVTTRSPGRDNPGQPERATDRAAAATVSVKAPAVDAPKVKVVDVPPGAGRFVGLWALANHALEYPFLGPMFEEAPSSSSSSPAADAVAATS